MERTTRRAIDRVVRPHLIEHLPRSQFRETVGNARKPLCQDRTQFGGPNVAARQSMRRMMILPWCAPPGLMRIFPSTNSHLQPSLGRRSRSWSVTDVAATLTNRRRRQPTPAPGIAHASAVHALFERSTRRDRGRSSSAPRGAGRRIRTCYTAGWLQRPCGAEAQHVTLSR